MNERERLTGFMLGAVDFLRRQCSDGSFDRFAEGAKVALQRSGPISGWRQAAGDTVEMCQDLSSAAVAQLDAELLAANLPTLTQMRNRQFRKIQAILDRGAIRSEAQYRLLDSVLSDTAGTILTEAERVRADQLLAAYHAR
jgi:hypothetical protein